MERIGTLLICLLAGFCSIARAEMVVKDDSNASYDRIVTRNIFNLHGPPQVSPERMDAPSPHVRLDGITTIFGDKRALITVKQDTVAGNPAGREESYILAEGQRAGGFEVLEVNVETRTVRLDHNGGSLVITFEAAKVQAPEHQPFKRPFAENNRPDATKSL